jgi:serine/threonine protein phosphatase PrpC
VRFRESLTYHAVSERGRRERNEDAFLTERMGRFHVFAVADGMGGHETGDVACAIA